MSLPDTPPTSVFVDEAERKIGPIQTTVNLLFNQMLEARSVGDQDEFENASVQCRDEIQEFARLEMQTHRNPEWIINVLWGNYYYCRGELDTAVEWETKGRQAAKLPKHVWLSEVNLCSCHRENGRLAEAVVHARNAFAVDPVHPISHLQLGLCLALAGNEADADDIFRRLIARADFSNPSDLLAAVLEFEEPLHNLKLPSVVELKYKLDAAKARRAGTMNGGSHES